MSACFALIEATTLGGSPDRSAEDMQQYRNDCKSLISWLNSSPQRTSADLGGFEKFADDLDREWSKENREYHARLMLEICKPLSSGQFKDERRYVLARKYALSALERQDTIPLSLNLELIGHVTTFTSTTHAPEGEDFAQRRSKDVVVRLQAWRRLINAIDPNWNPDEHIMGENIDPPAATGLPTGVAPAAIKDPKLRAAYEEEIQRNRQKAERYREQYEALKWLKRYPKRAEESIIAAYSQPPFKLEELRQALDIYLTDKETKTRILDTVEKSVEVQTKEKSEGVERKR